MNRAHQKRNAVAAELTADDPDLAAEQHAARDAEAAIAAVDGDRPLNESAADAFAALQTIDQARVAVERARERWREAREIALTARKAYDAELETFLSIVRRKTRVPLLPLFTADAEADSPSRGRA